MGMAVLIMTITEIIFVTQQLTREVMFSETQFLKCQKILQEIVILTTGPLLIGVHRALTTEQGILQGFVALPLVKRLRRRRPARLGRRHPLRRLE